MEYTQWVQRFVRGYALWSLNPCCNGIYSMRHAIVLNDGAVYVLILVVMEYTQWVLIIKAV